MKSLRSVLLTLTATVSFAVLPSCALLEALLTKENLELLLNGTSTAAAEGYYDENGYPIFGYDGEYPVYGYDPSGNPIYDVNLLDETSTVPEWSAASASADTTTSDTTTYDSSATQTSYDASSTYGTQSAGTSYGSNAPRAARTHPRFRSGRRASAPPTNARYRHGFKHPRGSRHAGRHGAGPGPRRMSHGAGPGPRKMAPSSGKHASRGMNHRSMEHKKSPDLKPGSRANARKSVPEKNLKPGKSRAKSRDDEKGKKKSSR